MPEVPDTVDDALDALSSPSTDDVEDATRGFSSREIGSSAASRAMGAGGGGGSQPGAISVLDLGIVNSVDLLDGPQTLYTPAEGTFFALTIGPDDFIAPDYRTEAGNTGTQGLGFGPVINFAQMTSAADVATPSTIFGTHGVYDQFSQAPSEHNLRAIVGPSFGAVVAALHLFWDDVAVLAPTVSWSGTHAFPAGSVLVAGGKLFTSAGGISGGSEPNWATAVNAGNTVSDGTVTWTFQGSSTLSNLPTQGSLHFYALVATPVSP